jgi:hypothetical protein
MHWAARWWSICRCGESGRLEQLSQVLRLQPLSNQNPHFLLLQSERDEPAVHSATRSKTIAPPADLPCRCCIWTRFQMPAPFGPIVRISCAVYASSSTASSAHPGRAVAREAVRDEGPTRLICPIVVRGVEAYCHGATRVLRSTDECVSTGCCASIAST